jgi:hypothetical protein
LSPCEGHSTVSKSFNTSILFDFSVKFVACFVLDKSKSSWQF